MRLGYRIFFLLFGVFLLYLGLVGLVLKFLFFPILAEWEQQLARLTVTRCVAILENEAEHLRRQTIDYAHWNETARFMRERDQDYLHDSFSTDQLNLNQMSFAIFLDDNFQEVATLSNNDGTAAAGVPGFDPALFKPASPVFKFGGLEESTVGFYASSEGPLILAAANILGSRTDSRRRGILIIGRRIDAHLLNSLVHQTKTVFELLDTRDVKKPDPALRMKNLLTGPNRLLKWTEGKRWDQFNQISPLDTEAQHLDFYATGKEMMQIYSEIPGSEGPDGVTLQVKQPRVLFVLFSDAAYVTGLSFLGVGIIVLSVTLLFVEIAVLRPLRRLAKHINRVQEDGDLSTRLDYGRKDELGALALRFNSMMERLQADDKARREAEDSLRESRETYRNLAIHDDLTGLFNTRYMYRNLETLFTESKRDQKPFSLIFMDIDHFKHVVDTYGHLNGSQAIHEVAATILACIQKPAYAVSYGGDEFVIVLPGFDKARALAKAEEIRVRMNETIYLESKNLRVQLSASLGAASYPADAADMEGLLALADKTLFYVKSRGKNSVGGSGGEEI